MPCGYYDESKDTVMSGIYCHKYGGRPGNAYWRCYCDGRSSDCPYLGGSDPYELHPDTRERNRVIAMIDSLPSRITVNDGGRIDNAKWAYGQLHYDQQRFVHNHSRLTAAEQAYRDALQEADEQKREQARQEQSRVEKARKETVPTSQYTSSDKHSAGYTGTYDRREWPKGYVQNLNTGQWHKQTLGELFYSWLRLQTDLRINKPSWEVVIYRIVLAVWSVYLATLFESGQPPVSVILLAAFCVLQLVSMILGYFFSEAMKLRIALWVTELILALIVGIMIYQDINGGFPILVAWVILPYPVLMLAYKILKRLILSLL